MTSIPIFSFCAPSNTGKTTFICQVIGHLKGKGINVGVVKSCHHPLNPDEENTDSGKMKLAGADSVYVLNDKNKWADARMNMQEMDIILVEGGRTLGVPIVLMPDWKKDKNWTKPQQIFCDLNEVNKPLERVCSLLLEAIHER